MDSLKNAFVIKTPEHIDQLRPYQAGKPIETLAREKGLTRIVKLASNENSLGPSPKAVQAIKEFAGNVNRYPDPAAYDLVEALSEKFKLNSEQIICGHGSDALIFYLINAFTDTQDEILTSEGTFIGTFLHAKKLNRKLNLVPLKDYRYDLEALKRANHKHVKIIYLANPNNPTGTYLNRSELQEFFKSVRSDQLVILDEAYTLFASERPDYPIGLDWVRQGMENLVVTRTFSKDYGLAGLRVGFAASTPQIVTQLYKVRFPFEPNLLAQVAARAVLSDQAFLDESRSVNRQSLRLLAETYDELGIRYLDTAANFHLLLFSTEDGAAQFVAGCQGRGLIVRHVKAFGITQGVRVSSGTLEETEFARKTIQEVMLRKSSTN